MSVRYTFLAVDDDHQLVMDWFSALPDEKTEKDRADGRWYFFRGIARQPLASDEIDQATTPLVWVSRPQKRRGTLWTDAEVVFTPTPLKPQFPVLQKVSLSFLRWLKSFDLVFTQKVRNQQQWAYYLEAGIQNYDAELYALPRAMEALRRGQYFIHHQATDDALDTLAKTLRLRGYNVEAAEPARASNAGTAPSSREVSLARTPPARHG